MAELTYASYLHLDELLKLQHARSSPSEHDELLFIVIHQSTELWLKELLHELDKVKADFAAGLVSAATATLTRARRIFRVLVQQLDVLETMTPLSFSLFRHRLEHASGFQSMQFRELEFVLGIKRPGALDHYPADLAGIEAPAGVWASEQSSIICTSYSSARPSPFPASSSRATSRSRPSRIGSYRTAS